MFYLCWHTKIMKLLKLPWKAPSLVKFLHDHTKCAAWELTSKASYDVHSMLSFTQFPDSLIFTCKTCWISQNTAILSAQLAAVGCCWFRHMWILVRRPSPAGDVKYPMFCHLQSTRRIVPSSVWENYVPPFRMTKKCLSNKTINHFWNHGWRSTKYD